MAGLTEARLRALLRYCKLEDQKDEAEVRELIPLYFEDAVDYLADAGVAEPPEGTARRTRFDLLVSRMVLDAWDHRDGRCAETVKDDPAFRRKLNQLKLTEPVSDLDTLF